MYKAVHEPLVLPSRLPGLQRLAPWNEIVERAMAKDPAQRYGDAGQFLDGLEATLGRLHSHTISDATITSLVPRPPLVPVGETVTGGSMGAAAPGSTGMPTHFSAEDLAPLVARLGRYIGPMAQVLVRRVARGCPDLATLQARLAEQLTDPAARTALQHELQGLGTGSRATPTGAGMAPVAAPAMVSPALIDAAQRRLAHEVGPIAAVLVKRALAAAPQREAFLQRLAAAVDDPAVRARLEAAFRQLPE
jgi:serine/threonine-protein kinase